MRIKSKLIAIIICLIAQSAGAIVIRHDVDDSRYKKHAISYAPSMAYINGCSATLIASRWILTAAHCLYGFEKSLFDIEHLGRRYRIEKTIIHPNYNTENGQVFDIALVHLINPVKNGKPALLYSKSDEKGKAVVFVGNGMFGNGKDGLIRDDNLVRAATNRIDDVSNRWLEFKFNQPSDASALEGISGPGDSGGPAFIEINNRLYVAGVSSWQAQFGQPEGTYNVKEHYSRVSQYIEWLESTIKSTPPALVPSHPVFDAITSESLHKLRIATKNDKSWFSDKVLLDEAVALTLVQNSIDLMQELITLGAPVATTKVNQLSLFEFALLSRRNEYFAALMKATSKDINLHSNDSIILPLFVSRFIDDSRLKELVTTLLFQGANIDAVTPQGDTALLITGWQSSNLDLIKLLVDHGANIDTANKNGDTALMDAAYLGKKEILQFLLAKGAKTHLKNNKSKTALDLAQSKKRQEIVELILTRIASKPITR